MDYKAPVVKRRTCGVAVSLLLLVCPKTAEPRRLPAPGGEVRVHLGELDGGDLTESLTSSPLIEPPQRALSPAAAAAWPTLDGHYRSRFISGSESLEGGARWTLTPQREAEALTEAVSQCLSPGSTLWPGRALAAARIQADVHTRDGRTEVTFNKEVGDLPLILSGCPAGTGAFSPSSPGIWTAQKDAPGGRPLLGRVLLVSDPLEADLLPAANSVGGELLVAEWPDVWILLQDSRVRAEDPWKLEDGPESRIRFQRDLAPDLILAVRRGGRGSPTQSLLPPGVAPDSGSRPHLPQMSSTSLTLQPLPPGAPGIRIHHKPDDRLAHDLRQRLALLLRARGWRVETNDASTPTARIVRWRPPVADPALAVLLLADEFGLALPDHITPRLFSSDRALRTATALTIERAWMDSRLATPLLTATRALAINPRLQGVRLRGDGLPVLDDAWWVQP